MLVLVSFVLVLAAAVTLVIGLLQSGLTLIYLSIACSVLAGVVLAVAVLRGRPEPKPAAAGRSFAPPAPSPAAQVPASVGAPAANAETTSSWSSPSAPPPPPPAYTPPAAERTEDSATKAAGAALLGRLRGRRGDGDKDKGDDAPPADVPAVDVEPEPIITAAPGGTTQMPAVSTPVAAEDEDGFPIPDYDRLRATELLARLPALDRNQLEAVRDREAAGKNRFTVMSRVESLLATKEEEAAWDVADDEWEVDEAEREPEVLVAEAVAVDDEFETDDEFTAGEPDEDMTATSAGSDFPIPGYDTLTVGQILPKLSALSGDELAQVRAREELGRRRGTILDRIDRLASRAAPAAVAMPPAPVPAAPTRARKAPARKAPAASRTTAPAVRKTTKVTAPKVAAPRRKAAAADVSPAEAAPVTPVPPVAKVPAARRVRAPKAVAPVVPVEPAPAKEAVKKARAATKRTRKA